MDLKVLIAIALLPMALWVLRAVFGKEEERPNLPRPGQRPQRPATSDMERFLEEINRRRREAVRPPAAKVERRPPTAAPAPRPKPVARPARKEPEVVEVVVVEEPVKRTGLKQPAVPAAARPEAVAPRAQATIQVRSGGGDASPLLRELRALLRSPNTVRSAIMLHEVLGTPLCRRGPRLRPGSGGPGAPGSLD